MNKFSIKIKFMHKISVSILAIFCIFLSSCGQKEVASQIDLSTAQAFEFHELNNSELNNPISAWATNYYIPEFQNGSGDIALRDVNGVPLGPMLSTSQWCGSALEGSVRIRYTSGESEVYNYGGKSSEHSVNCSAFLVYDISKTKFRFSNSEFGEGVDLYNLVPYRSLATDNLFIPPGTVLYIPSARGNRIKIGDKFIIHDGYFFVADRGGAIKDNHIDVFTGVDKNSNFFPWVGHKSKANFNVYIVNDAEIIEQLTELHLKK